MPSVSYRHWRTVRRAVLDRVQNAHTTIHGTGSGRREATRQINHGYAVLLAAQFQGFCRDLHEEAANFFVTTIPTAQQRIVAQSLALSRQLDRGNANTSSLGTDFGRLGLMWWTEVDRVEPTGPVLRRELDELNAWRNAIAHSDFNATRLGGTIILKLSMVRRWRRACNQLARAFDRVLANHLQTCTGQLPW